MANWSKNKVDSSVLNGGQEYTKDNNVSLDQLNAITNNSFYAVDKADEALVKANSAFENNGTVVKVANSAVTGLNFDSDPQTQIKQLENTVNSNTSDINNLKTTGNSKANIDATNLSISNIALWQTKLNNLGEASAGYTMQGQATVIESYLSSDGLTWYRKWSDGWKECGMLYQSSSISLSQGESKDLGLIALPIQFSNTNYNVQCTTTWTASAGHQFVFDTSKTSNTNNSIFLVVLRLASSGSASPACFITCAGY